MMNKEGILDDFVKIEIGHDEPGGEIGSNSEDSSRCRVINEEDNRMKRRNIDERHSQACLFNMCN